MLLRWLNKSAVDAHCIHVREYYVVNTTTYMYCDRLKVFNSLLNLLLTFHRIACSRISRINACTYVMWQFTYPLQRRRGSFKTKPRRQQLVFFMTAEQELGAIRSPVARGWEAITLAAEVPIGDMQNWQLGAELGSHPSSYPQRDRPKPRKCSKTCSPGCSFLVHVGHDETVLHGHSEQLFLRNLVQSELHADDARPKSVKGKLLPVYAVAMFQNGCFLLNCMALNRAKGPLQLKNDAGDACVKNCLWLRFRHLAKWPLQVLWKANKP
jgi:hypothetical protein